jgi:hypothetical protein
MKKFAIAALGLAAFGLAGCDSPLLHQDRPGGSDYRAGSSSSYDRGYGDRDERGRSGELRDRDSRWQDPAARSDDDLYRSRRNYWRGGRPDRNAATASSGSRLQKKRIPLRITFLPHPNEQLLRQKRTT